MSGQKVFVTGAAGYIGGSIATRLMQLGYEVGGLVRSSKDAKCLEEAGMRIWIGTLDNANLLKECVEWADSVINAADYEHAYAVSTFLDTLANSGKTYIHISGSSIAGVASAGEADSRVFTEKNMCPRLEKAQLAAIHTACIEAANKNIRTIVIVPSLIYGPGTGIKTEPIIFSVWGELANTLGGTPYLGKGENIWSNVHMQDLVDLFILALEKAESGSTFFAENGQASARTMAEIINRRHNLKKPVFSLPLNYFIEKYGLPFAHTFFGGNSRIDSTNARKLLGWTPKFNNLEETLLHYN